MIATNTLRALTALGLLAALSACGGEVPVRDTPQAVHPSPSALAQGTAFASPPTYEAPEEEYTYAANDGSRPIID